MLGLFKHLKLILVELFVDPVLFEFLLLYHLDGTLHIGALMLAKYNSAEGSRSKLATTRVVIAKVVNLFKLHLLLERQEVLGLLAPDGTC